MPSQGSEAGQEQAGEELVKYQQLFEFCLSKKAVFYIKQAPRDDLSADEFAALGQIYEHFRPSDPANANTIKHAHSGPSTSQNFEVPTENRPGHPRTSREPSSTPTPSKDQLETMMAFRLQRRPGFEDTPRATVEDESRSSTPHDNITPTPNKRGYSYAPEDSSSTPDQSEEQITTVMAKRLKLGLEFEETSEASRSKQKARGRPPKRTDAPPALVKSTDSWGAVRRLEHLSLDEVVKAHLQANPNHSPTIFLQSYGEAFTAPSGQNVPIVQILANCCTMLKTMETTAVMSHIRWLFVTLAVGDMTVAMYGGKGGLTERKKSEFRASLVQAYGPERSDSFERMLTAGDRLVFLCNRLGTGSLLWLQSLLTSNFITHRITKTGVPFDNAMEHIKGLKLSEKIEDSGANTLGDAIRSHLRDVFKVDQFALGMGTNGNSEENSGQSGTLSTIIIDGNGEGGSGGSGGSSAMMPYADSEGSGRHSFT